MPDVDSFLTIRERSPLFPGSPTTSVGPVFDVTPLATCPPIRAEAVVNKTAEEVVVIDVSTGKQKEHVKKPTLKRAAQSPGNAPKLKKMKKVIVDASDDAIYKQ